jgi:ornithine cyclodeaminase/alanine dehydrogenase-like protein (mu-crystallin family)
VLILSNEDVEQVLTMPLVMRALEQAYRDLGAGEATTVPRVDTLAPHPSRPEAAHAFKTMSGSWPRHRVTALRLNSDVIDWPVGSNGARRRRKIPAGPGNT